MASRTAHVSRRPERRLGGLAPPALIWWLSPLLVGITTCVVFWLQIHLTASDSHLRIRPYGIALLLPVMVLTAWGGRRVGWLTLALAVFSCTYVLEQPHFVWSISTARAGMELLFLTVIGAFVVLTVETRRQRTDFLEDVSATPKAIALIEEIRRIVGQFPGAAGVGDCLVYQRGLDIYLHLDLVVADDLPLVQARALLSPVEAALVEKMPLLFKIYIHLT